MNHLPSNYGKARNCDIGCPNQIMHNEHLINCPKLNCCPIKYNIEGMLGNCLLFYRLRYFSFTVMLHSPTSKGLLKDTAAVGFTNLIESDFMAPNMRYPKRAAGLTLLYLNLREVGRH